MWRPASWVMVCVMGFAGGVGANDRDAFILAAAGQKAEVTIAVVQPALYSSPSEFLSAYLNDPPSAASVFETHVEELYAETNGSLSILQTYDFSSSLKARIDLLAFDDLSSNSKVLSISVTPPSCPPVHPNHEPLSENVSHLLRRTGNGEEIWLRAELLIAECVNAELEDECAVAALQARQNLFQELYIVPEETARAFSFSASVNLLGNSRTLCYLLGRDDVETISEASELDSGTVTERAQEQAKKFGTATLSVVLTPISGVPKLEDIDMQTLLPHQADAYTGAILAATDAVIASLPDGHAAVRRNAAPFPVVEIEVADAAIVALVHDESVQNVALSEQEAIVGIDSLLTLLTPENKERIESQLSGGAATRVVVELIIPDGETASGIISALLARLPSGIAQVDRLLAGDTHLVLWVDQDAMDALSEDSAVATVAPWAP